MVHVHLWRLLGVVLVLAPFVTSLMAGEKPADNDPIVIGTYHEIASDILGEDRMVSVYLPYGYDDSDAGYPVLYVLDGHMDSRVMHAASAMEIVDGSSRMPQTIVVGIHATNAVRDYFPQPLESRPESGHADIFIKFLREELIPWVDGNYRTEPYRVLCGASNSGMLTVYTLLTAPETFSAYLSASPSVGWFKDYMLEQAKTAFEREEPLTSRLYMNWATDDYERIVSSAMPDFVATFETNAPPSLRWKADLLENAGHVPYISIHDGLRFIFDGWKYPDSQLESAGLDGIKSHYANLSDEFGFDVRIPSGPLMDLGQTFLRSEDWPKAIDVFLEYVTEYPNSIHAHYFLGEAYRQQGDVALARECYKKVLQIDPEFSRAQSRLEALNSEG
jgi:predicted alpha/beta superfamily hydrolase